MDKSGFGFFKLCKYMPEHAVFFCSQDRRIDELRRLLRRYKKIEELVAQAQGRKGKGYIAQLIEKLIF